MADYWFIENNNNKTETCRWTRTDVTNSWCAKINGGKLTKTSSLEEPVTVHSYGTVPERKFYILCTISMPD